MGEVVVVLVIALLVFGGRLPKVARSVGLALVEFKEGLKGKAGSLTEDDEDVDEDLEDSDDLDDGDEGEDREEVSPPGP